MGMNQSFVARPAMGLALLAVVLTGAAPPFGGGPVVGFAGEGHAILESAGDARLPSTPGDGQIIIDETQGLGGVITVTLSEPAPVDMTVPYTIGGNATNGVDYAIPAGPLFIGKGRTTGILPLAFFDDEDHEGTESLTVTLGTPSVGTLGPITVYTVAINDTRLGDPIDGLTPQEMAAFRAGRTVFNRRFTPEEGLGPFYNASSCASCHSSPISGGAAELYRNFYLAVYYEFTPANQSSSIPPFLSQVVPAFGSGDLHQTATFKLDGARPQIPPTVFGVPVLAAQRNSIPVFGTGLFEFVSDATILSNADPNDTLPPVGISGRINTQFNGGAIGRLGLKAQANNIELFTRGPLQNQMGITSDPLEGAGGIVSHLSMQVAASPNDPTVDNDGVPDPEISPEDLGNLIAFSRFLAPPPQKAFTAQARAGEATFANLGCTGCHIPELPSSKGPVRAYSDLLLHDMGSSLADNIKLGDSPFALTEFRTQPLWGISEVGPYLHDGRAHTLHEAIALHGGEAASQRNAYLALSAADQEALIVFLEHL